ncbi:MAG: alpha/beta fold hydrolase [Burkholderiaceae bacterium]
MASESEARKPPSRNLMLMELRAIWELGAYFTLAPLLRRAPRGDGHPVLVLPGLLASDASTVLMRAFLRDRGYHVHGWKLGPNHGPRPGAEEKMQERLASLFERHGRKVSLVGWSLGGVFARELARRAPEQVRGVITLGSPFAGSPKASNAWKVYERVSGTKAEPHVQAHRGDMGRPMPVPATAIYTRTDGIVNWRGCLEREGPLAENIEIEGSHCGLGHNPAVLFAIADRLAQPEGQWRHFDRSGARGLIYRDPHRDRGVAA